MKEKAFTISLWSTQVLLAALFVMAGFMKLSTPIATLGESLPWVLTAPPMLVRFIGLAEIAGGLGVLLPIMTRILPFLTPLAASGLLTVMVLASGLHMVRGEFSNIIMNLILGAMALFVAWGRSETLTDLRNTQ